jgi:hypothetical protein
VRRTQRALRQLDSYEFRHTLRTGNKMAVFLANVAMDQGYTSNGPDGPELTTQTLYDLLDADTQHDTTPPHPTHDLLSTLRAHLTEQRPTPPHLPGNEDPAHRQQQLPPNDHAHSVEIHPPKQEKEEI